MCLRKTNSTQIRKREKNGEILCKCYYSHYWFNRGWISSDFVYGLGNGLMCVIWAVHARPTISQWSGSGIFKMGFMMLSREERKGIKFPACRGGGVLHIVNGILHEWQRRRRRLAKDLRGVTFCTSISWQSRGTQRHVKQISGRAAQAQSSSLFNPFGWTFSEQALNEWTAEEEGDDDEEIERTRTIPVSHCDLFQSSSASLGHDNFRELLLYFGPENAVHCWQIVENPATASSVVEMRRKEERLLWLKIVVQWILW